MRIHKRYIVDTITHTTLFPSKSLSFCPPTFSLFEEFSLHQEILPYETQFYMEELMTTSSHIEALDLDGDEDNISLVNHNDINHFIYKLFFVIFLDRLLLLRSLLD